MLSLENVAGKRDGFVNVRVLDSPGPPVNLIPREITKTSITMQWEIPIIDGGSKIINYVIEKREATRKAYTVISTTWQKCSFKYDNLDEGSEYYFRVSAENELGVGEPAETPETIRASQAPTAPENLYVTDVSVDTASLAWTKPKHDGGSRITGYVIEAQKKDTETWTHVRTVKALDYTATDLIENMEYVFRIMAVNSSGRSNPRESRPAIIREQTAAPVFDLRGVYQSLVIAKAGDNVKVEIPVLGRPRPSVSWKRGEDTLKQTQRINTDTTATSTTLHINEIKRTDGGTFSMTGKNILGTTTETITLLKGNEYIFRVMAVNIYGTGEPLESNPMVSTNPYVPADAPTTPEVTTITKNTMVVCWERPDHDGGSSIFNYVVERRDKTGLRWVKCNKRTVTDLRYKVSGLTPGHEYEFRIIAENNAGLGTPSPSSEFYKAVDTIFQPGPPGNQRVLDTTKSSITVAWNKPVYDGGSDIIGYIVETCLPEEDEWTIRTPKKGLVGTSFTITNLVENQDYKINICAVNCEGVGEPAQVPETTRVNADATDTHLYLVVKEASREDVGKYTIKLVNTAGEATVDIGVVVLDKPGPPTGPITLDEVTSDSVVLSWNPPTYVGGCAINNYVVEKRETTSTNWQIVSATLIPDSRFKLGGLDEGIEYEYRVYAENIVGVGKASKFSDIRVARDPCDSPGKPEAVIVTRGAV
uniref:Fibronectin type-III domain-containing protein n=1 Tax=Oncorhynchus kisutch TaxID=8019 RepID=A0A8C7GG53_ONCKI